MSGRVQRRAQVPATVLLASICILLSACSDTSEHQTLTPQSEKSTLLPFGSFNPPEPNARVHGAGVITGGWAIHESGIRSVDLYVDRRFFMKAEIGVDRPDVRAIYAKTYGPKAITGWNALMDLGSVEPGPHELLAKITANDGSSRDLVTPVIVVK